MLGCFVLSLTRHFPEARAIRHHKPLQLPSPASSTGFDDVASRGFAMAGPPGEVAAVNLRSSRVVTLAFEQHFRLWLCGPCLLGISILVPPSINFGYTRCVHSINVWNMKLGASFG